ncbi:hypothetical protein C8F04DRAFT_1319223 [Mycena alexandri]|uniref:Ricin B lectin domain-containing protein n=1 Tax=Mycena alexandri TaxID=1745969 RepID=A0AAD6WPD8_9AGAR|nr:hypothetical protein C8F04DRAFT_1319223 [Mycena alexandri]
MKAVSLVVVTAGLFAAVGASALARRASPAPDAAAAHVIIHPLLDSTLCITATGFSNTNLTVLSPCSPQGISTLQLWGVNAGGGGGNSVQFQSVGTNLCFAVGTTTPTNGMVITGSGCVNSNGVVLSGTSFDASQTITQSKLPLVLTALNSQVGNFTNTGFCLDRAGSSLVVNACNGGLSQSWLMESF